MSSLLMKHSTACCLFFLWIGTILAAPEKLDFYQSVLKEETARLQTGSAAERYEAALALGRMEEKAAQAIPVLIAHLGDLETVWVPGGQNEGAFVCHAVQLALERIGEPAVEPLLDTALTSARGQPDMRQKNAIEVLGKIGGPRAVPHLLRQLRNPSAPFRPEIAAALGQIGGKGVTEALLRALSYSDPALQLSAAQALARLEGEKAAPALLPLLQDRDPAVRGETARLLSQMKYQPAAQPITRLFLDANQGVRDQAVKALSHLQPPPQALTSLIKTAKRANPQIAGYALRAIRNIRDAEAVGPLTQVLRGGSAALREAAAEALGNTGAPDAVPPLAKLLESPRPGLRQAAVAALARIPNSSATAALYRATRDDDPRIKKMAEEAISQRDDPKAFTIALNDLNHSDPEIRQNAAKNLARIGNPQALPALIQTLRYDPAPDVRALAGKALGETGDKNALGPLIKQLHETEDKEARNYLINAISNLTGAYHRNGQDWLHWYLGKMLAIGTTNGERLASSRGASLIDEIKVYRKFTREQLFQQAATSLNDTKMRKRLAAVEVLGALKDKKAVPLLKKRFQEDTALQPHIQQALAEIENRRLPPLTHFGMMPGKDSSNLPLVQVMPLAGAKEESAPEAMNVDAFLQRLRIDGIGGTTGHPKVMLNGRLYEENDMVNKKLRLKIHRITAREIVFVDSSGEKHRRSF